MLQLFGGWGCEVVEFSASLSQHQRAKALKSAKKDKPCIIVASDAAARGIDLPSLDAVIQYDVPSHLKGYIHRVGRTARAGRIGVSYTLVKPEQVCCMLSLCCFC